MVCKTVPINTDGVKEPSINSTGMINIIAADQAGIMSLIIDVKVKQNFRSFVHEV